MFCICLEAWSGFTLKVLKYCTHVKYMKVLTESRQHTSEWNFALEQKVCAWPVFV